MDSKHKVSMYTHYFNQRCMYVLMRRRGRPRSPLWKNEHETNRLRLRFRQYSCAGKERTYFLSLGIYVRSINLQNDCAHIYCTINQAGASFIHNSFALSHAVTALAKDQ